MRKHSLEFVTLAFLASLAGIGCSDDSGDGGGGSGPVGPPPPISGGTGGAGMVVSFAGTSSNPGGGASTFDGGTAPLTPEEAAVIRDDQCASWVTEGEVQPTMLQLVVDISSSMNEIAPGAGMQTRWQIASVALIEAIVGDSGPGLPADVSVGMLLYPGLQTGVSTMPQDPALCVNVDAMVPPAELGGAGSAQRDLVRQGIENAMLLQSTPTLDAYRLALNDSLLPARFGGPKFMLLITDGAPTINGDCWTESGGVQGGGVDPQPIVDEIERAAAEEGIKTFLIGVPGSEPNRQWMSRAAVLGGTAPAGCSVDGGGNNSYCHMDMTTAPDFGVALRAGLNEVVGAVSPCTFSFAEPPDGEEIDPSKINVLLSSNGEDTLIVRDDIGDCTEGWQLTQDNQILLCSDTCDHVQSTPGITVDLTFGCRSYREPPIVE